MSSNPSPSSGPLTRPDEIAPGEHYWVKVSRDLRHRLNESIPHETLKELHRKSPARHLGIAARQRRAAVPACERPLHGRLRVHSGQGGRVQPRQQALGLIRGIHRQSLGPSPM